MFLERLVFSPLLWFLLAQEEDVKYCLSIPCTITHFSHLLDYHQRTTTLSFPQSYSEIIIFGNFLKKVPIPSKTLKNNFQQYSWNFFSCMLYLAYRRFSFWEVLPWNQGLELSTRLCRHFK